MLTKKSDERYRQVGYETLPSGARPQNSLLGPGPKTKSQGPGLKI